MPDGPGALEGPPLPTDYSHDRIGAKVTRMIGHAALILTLPLLIAAGGVGEIGATAVTGVVSTLTGATQARQVLLAV